MIIAILRAFNVVESKAELFSGIDIYTSTSTSLGMTRLCITENKDF